MKINIDDVPESLRCDERLLRLIKYWQPRLDHPENYRNYRTGTVNTFDDTTIQMICTHEAGHMAYARQFGTGEFCGPSIDYYDGGFHFCPAMVVWTKNNNSSLDDTAKIMLAGPFVNEAVYKEPDYYRRGDIKNFRRYLDGLGYGSIQDCPFESLVSKTKDRILLDLEDQDFALEIFRIANDFFAMFKTWQQEPV